MDRIDNLPEEYKELRNKIESMEVELVNKMIDAGYFDDEIGEFIGLDGETIAYYRSLRVPDVTNKDKFIEVFGKDTLEGMLYYLSHVTTNFTITEKFNTWLDTEYVEKGEINDNKERICD